MASKPTFTQRDHPQARAQMLNALATQVSALEGGSPGTGVTSVNGRTGAVTVTSGDVTAALGYTPLRPANNLSDVSDSGTARTNLGLGTAATLASDIDTTLSANSDARLATQKAVKAYVDAAVVGLLDLKGATNCSANPNYPSALKGDYYYVSAAGRIGGAGGKAVAIGDVFVALTDNAGGTEAAVGASWFVLEHNLADLAAIAVSGSASDLASGTVPAARMPALTGDVTTAAGAVATTIANDAVTFAKIQNLQSKRIVGNDTAGVADPSELTGTQVTALLDTFGSLTKGLAPASGGGSVNFLRSDGLWVNPRDWTEKTITADFVAPNSVAFADITDGTVTLSFAPGANQSFEAQAVLMLETVTATNLPRVGIHVLAQGAGSYGCAQIDQTGATVTTRVTQDGTWTTAAVDIQMPAGGFAAANTPYMCFVTIRGKAGASPAIISLQLACETAAASTCKVRAGSQLRYKNT